MSVLQSHLYSQFLTGSAADVSLHIQGSWEAVYQLHRVVLIQAGYFNSLFSGGFLESQRPRQSRFVAPDVVRIRFDDPNITRAAFELCVARLYGGGPPLHVSPAFIPTPTRPLTPAFSSPASARTLPPAGHHNASPRFLLSLLATSAYLSIPTITTQALELILASVGPYTVLRYLNFAVGAGIGAPTPGELDAAAGLEHVGKKPSSTFELNATVSSAASTATSTSDEDEGDMPKKLGEINLSRQNSEHSELSYSSASSTIDDGDGGMVFNYGRVSEKVGEACVCFLARWGQDILQVEERAAEQGTSLSETLVPTAPVVWGRGGIAARLARAVISSDDFFIKGELERYDFACRVVEMRRRYEIVPSEEAEWDELFRTGIYYESLPHEELIKISRDISPATKRPYVPLQVIHAAHWNQSMLRSQIMSRPFFSSSPPSSPSSSSSRDRELGFCLTTAQIAAEQTGREQRKDVEQPAYYPVLNDSSLRIGTPPPHDASSREPASANQVRTGFAREFFGLQHSRHSTSAALAADTSGRARWSPYPPFRFSVEFWDVKDLDQKVFSHTVWYGGSLFNVYAQLVRKKGLQLGVYLHRQSSVESIPRPSSPPGQSFISPGFSIAAPRPESWSGISAPRPSTGHSSRLSLGGSRPRSDSSGMRSTTPRAPTPRSTSPTPRYSHSGLPIVSSSPPLESMSASLGSPSRLHLSLPSVTTPAPAQPFRDPRSTILVYFGISCFVLPAALIRFSSSPDGFTVGQSWGWKSSSLCPDRSTDEGMGMGVTKASDDAREVSLRATVVIGLV
ncbi:hypothetical protein AURDEDRAFT_78202 [Auricularia subglabra TFB-10046 SS5]|nr:hypothetical protein AURDEDRAFT_78202 [Auricularia subglabra TFB-10046 SS5]